MDERFSQALNNLKNTDWAASFDDAAQSVLEEYVLSAPNMGNQNFEPFCNAFSQYLIYNPNADFYSAEIALARRSQEKSTNEPELFDEVNQQLIFGDANGLNILLNYLEQNCPKFAHLPPKFDHKFRHFIAKQMWCHSFSDKQIADLQQTLTAEVANTELQNIFKLGAKDISDINQQKIERDVNELNRWAFTFKSDDLLKKLSFRSTYANLAYELLVRKREIKNISPETYYQKHRLSTQAKINELTGTLDNKGKVICRKYALNKVYKSIASNDTFKLESVAYALNKSVNESYYDDCQTILKALEGGKKYREVKIPQKPFVWREH